MLELIEKRKLLINDISLAAVTDEYIAHLNSQKELPMGETAEFVALAATLLLIKSRSLLPTLELSDEESRDIKELEYRLAVYQLLKDAARSLTGALRNPPLYDGSYVEPEPLFIPDQSVTPQSLRDAARVLIEGFPSTLELPRVNVKKIISIEEMIDHLAQRVSSALSLSFRQFTDKREKGEVIVGFLALLELVKQGILKAHQEQKFGDIMLHSDAPSTPTYE